MPESGLIEKASDLMRRSRYAVALTGAGISTPSGIPDFRSPGGLWSQVDPMQVASLEAFLRNPRAFYDWFRLRAEAFFGAQPNPAHLALAELESRGELKALITQNIDDLHRRAGSRRIIELHGNAGTAHCLDCGRQEDARRLWERYQRDAEIPSCRSCGGTLKPKVILFGELLPSDALRQAWEEAVRCDLMLVVGSSLEVTPAADLPFAARGRGAQVIVVNLQPTPIDRYAEVVIHEDVAEILPRLIETYRSNKSTV
ncbi:MAG: NAD-dependent deacylase [Chloroflexi bacterium]|nr:NAD-dependent deacylase [Chloroflexota bacterium]